MPCLSNLKPSSYSSLVRDHISEISGRKELSIESLNVDWIRGIKTEFIIETFIILTGQQLVATQ